MRTIWPHRMKIVVAILAVLCSRHTPLFGQEAETNAEIGSQLTTASLVSAVVPITASSLQFVPLVFPETSSSIPWISNPLLLGSHVPLYWINAPPGGRLYRRRSCASRCRNPAHVCVGFRCCCVAAFINTAQQLCPSHGVFRVRHLRACGGSG